MTIDPKAVETAPFAEIFHLGEDTTPYAKISSEFVGAASFNGKPMLTVDPRALTVMTRAAFAQISHLLRPTHLAQLASILKDPEASDNDRFVALDLLKNANIAAGMVLPMCQDTGTATIIGHKGQQVWTGGGDHVAITQGVAEAYTQLNLRYSQVSPTTMFEEANTGNNLPAQIDIYAEEGDEYHLMFIAKGGGSANKFFLHQQTKALLNPESLAKFLDAQIRTLGTAACPPYHLAVAIGGMSAEMALKTAKLASTHYLDGLPTSGGKTGQAFRDLEWEAKLLEMTRKSGIGAQFGGKYFCHDARVIRLPRHGASCPVAIGVSCSADRQMLGKITREGLFLEQLETDPAKYLPEIDPGRLSGEVVKIDLRKPMSEIRALLSQYPIKTRVSLSGPMIVARDIAHAKLKEVLDKGGDLPDYFKNHPVYYAGPAKTPKGYASGAFGPTTAGRMDSYVDQFQSKGGSMVMLAKGNRSKAVTDACKKHGGFYLGSVGGSAAGLAQNVIRKVEVLAFPELGMEAVWKIEVEDFPAFIITDDKGNDFFAALQH